MTNDVRMGLTLFTFVLSIMSMLLSISVMRLNQKTKEQIEKNKIGKELIDSGFVIKSDDDLKVFLDTVNVKWRKEHGLK